MNIKKELIEKLYKGECSRNELEVLLDIISEDVDEDTDRILAHLWRQLESYPEIPEPLASRIPEKTLLRIEQQESARPLQLVSSRRNQQPRFNGNPLVSRANAIAAMLLLLLSALTWFWLESDKQVQDHTAFGEQKTIELPDHSVVKLNANSSITYRKKWDSSEVRQVWLEGEAYFSVRKNKSTEQQFQVITKNLTVEVLGTIFNVNTRNESTEVFLEEGKVNLDLQRRDDDVAMQPGDLVTYSAISQQPQKRQIVKESPTSWKDGTALFKDAPLREIIRKIKEVYGVSVIAENKSHLDRKFNIGIPVSDFETTYLMLKEVTGLEIERRDNEFIIK